MLNQEQKKESLEVVVNGCESSSSDIRDNLVDLREWTAQDFSRLYVRYLPHLVGYARRYLSDPLSADEVVQDAFLYLLTALPELDSELGVLRFLKWKIRNLSFDVLRSRRGNFPLEALPADELFSSEEAEVGEQIELADDAAIVRLALAQLSPRHRQALVSTVVQEKSSKDVALEMGLSENAFRQLLHRARRSFRQIFVGEAQKSDISVSEALRLASAKHRSAILSGTAAFLLVSIFSFSPGITGSPPIPEAMSEYSRGSLSLPDLGAQGLTPTKEAQSADENTDEANPIGFAAIQAESPASTEDSLLANVSNRAKSIETAALDTEIDYDPKIMLGASQFLDALSGNPVKTASHRGDGIISLDLEGGYDLSFFASTNDEGAYAAINFMTLNWAWNEVAFTAIPMATYITHDSLGSWESLQIVATGWVVLNVSDPSVTVAVENSHFFEIGLELSAQGPSVSELVWDASFVPRA